ncbi:uncharacterized protein UV8b_05496 [Ustilaginoidea virens]|uniref:Uncharacterized protein n=1 Tax=Ustilaginoidea virens TaxID=1159556 RepID=A0A8E5HTI3_USTVR|nr:uncharacterized protein UV8b_05496 [Ustilaginoidea virens]QUC21253.1 hypothetical protein UV8b_05496 [Ustilaginoidea virens]
MPKPPSVARHRARGRFSLRQPGWLPPQPGDYAVILAGDTGNTGGPDPAAAADRHGGRIAPAASKPFSQPSPTCPSLARCNRSSLVPSLTSLPHNHLQGTQAMGATSRLARTSSAEPETPFDPRTCVGPRLDPCCQIHTRPVMFPGPTARQQPCIRKRATTRAAGARKQTALRGHSLARLASTTSRLLSSEANIRGGGERHVVPPSRPDDTARTDARPGLLSPQQRGIFLRGAEKSDVADTLEGCKPIIDEVDGMQRELFSSNLSSGVVAHRGETPYK